MKKIGIDSHYLEGKRTGVGRYLLNLLKLWNIISPSEVKFILYFKKEIPFDLKLKEKFDLKLLKHGKFSNAFFIHWLLKKEAEKDKIDVLFCPGYIAPIFYNGNIALTIHDIIYETRPDLYKLNFADKILLKKVSKISSKKAKVIFVPSFFTKKELIKFYNINKEKILVTPLAVDDCFFSKKILEKKKSLIKKKYNIEGKFILYIGTIFNRRHIPEIIKAFTLLKEKKESFKHSLQFLIVGENRTSPFIDIDKLINKVNETLHRRAILRYNFINSNDLFYLYHLAELFIYISEYEGFGLPLLEAMACKTPVITSPFASIPEVVGESAIFVKNPNNIKEISNAIYTGLTDKNLRENLIHKGIEQVRKFSWEKCAEKTLKALLSIS